MMKNYSFAIIVGLICLLIGFLYGKSKNDVGRYTFHTLDYRFLIFDTATGTYYFQGSNRTDKLNVPEDYMIQQEKEAQLKKIENETDTQCNGITKGKQM